MLASTSPVIVAGLGNPGEEYRETRHNVGFMVMDELAGRLRARLKPGRGEYVLARTSVGSEEVLLLKPVTYMNNSGLAIAQAVEEFSLPLERLLVVVDDFALPLGSLRFRTGGSDGGHNGLGSIIYSLASDEFPRLRCGIGREGVPPGDVMRDFVLSPFDVEERPVALSMITRAATAVLTFVSEGINQAMNRFNSQGTSNGTLSPLNP